MIIIIKRFNALIAQTDLCSWFSCGPPRSSLSSGTLTETNRKCNNCNANTSVIKLIFCYDKLKTLKWTYDPDIHVPIFI